MSTPIQQDIEIYVRDLSLSELEVWLNQNFRAVTINDQARTFCSQGRAFKLQVHTIEDKEIVVFINPRAVGNTFSSIWFQSTETPWLDDISCAQSMLAFADKEVRCSAAGWTDDEDIEGEMWWRMDRQQKELIRWN